MNFLLPWQRVRVAGSSMTPTLLPGDSIVVRHGARVRVGAVVLARFRSRPGLEVVKRVAGGDERGGWVLASDNARGGSDSREYGVADVQAVAVLLLPGRSRVASHAPLGARLRRRVPQRIPAAPPDGL